MYARTRCFGGWVMVDMIASAASLKRMTHVRDYEIWCRSLRRPASLLRYSSTLVFLARCASLTRLHLRRARFLEPYAAAHSPDLQQRRKKGSRSSLLPIQPISSVRTCTSG
jgi:hypothetical protein